MPARRQPETPKLPEVPPTQLFADPVDIRVPVRFHQGRTGQRIGTLQFPTRDDADRFALARLHGATDGWLADGECIHLSMSTDQVTVLFHEARDGCPGVERHWDPVGAALLDDNCTLLARQWFSQMEPELLARDPSSPLSLRQGEVIHTPSDIRPWILDGLLSHSFVLGYQHGTNETSVVRFLVEHMEDLARNGYTTLYTEGFTIDDQPWLDISESPPTSKAPAKWQPVVEAAARCNIQVIGLDAHEVRPTHTADKANDQRVFTTGRIASFNHVARNVILFHEARRPAKDSQPGKYVVCCGSGHARKSHPSASLRHPDADPVWATDCVGLGPALGLPTVQMGCIAGDANGLVIHPDALTDTDLSFEDISRARWDLLLKTPFRVPVESSEQEEEPRGRTTERTGKPAMRPSPGYAALQITGQVVQQLRTEYERLRRKQCFDALLMLPSLAQQDERRHT